MDERLSEAPSDEELREYLMDNLRMSAIAWHFPDSQFSTGHLDPRYLSSLRAYPLVGGGLFLERIVETLSAALRRLNAVPRDDPFWETRNKRPTLYKLRDYNYHIFKKNPDDPLTLWTQAALFIVHGTNNFGAKQWRRLHYVGEFDVSWPILAALVTELNAEPTAEQLVELLDRIEMVDEALAFLKTFDACGDDWIVEWRDGVVKALTP
jgi:hypothetical protein